MADSRSRIASSINARACRSSECIRSGALANTSLSSSPATGASSSALPAKRLARARSAISLTHSRNVEYCSRRSTSRISTGNLCSASRPASVIRQIPRDTRTISPALLSAVRAQPHRCRITVVEPPATRAWRSASLSCSRSATRTVTSLICRWGASESATRNGRRHRSVVMTAIDQLRCEMGGWRVVGQLAGMGVPLSHAGSLAKLPSGFAGGPGGGLRALWKGSPEARQRCSSS